MSDASEPGAPTGVRRTVIADDGIAWLEASALGMEHAIVTSLPDYSELHGMTFEAWRSWFVDTAALVCASVDEAGVAIFYQTDIRRGFGWIDKGHLVSLGADRAGVRCIDHRIVCRVPAGMSTSGRPGYAHLIAFSRGVEVVPDPTAPDVLPQLGEMTWSRAMGTAACEAACLFLRRNTRARIVVDPFCGYGTMLAVANAYGFDAIGVEISEKHAARARRLRFVRGVGLA